jgi:hypothetical protein
MSDPPSKITRWLENAPTSVLTIYSTIVAFSTYFCMYAFRKPFAAGSYEGQFFFGSEIALKTALVISQILGYTLSKYIGVKVCSEVTRKSRGLLLIALVLVAETALLLFAFLPPNLKVAVIFFNGLPLGMVWGLVVIYLEGRRTSEILLAGLSCSFIIASGVVKDVGLTLMTSYGVSEPWMPFATGLLFLPLFVLSTWLLDQIPAPSDADVAARTERAPMQRDDRREFLRRFLPGLIALFVVYLLLTAFRDFRDNYGIEIFKELGEAGTTALFARTEVPVAFGVMVTMSLLSLVKDNRRGLSAIFGIMTVGFLLLAISTYLLDRGIIGGLGWMMMLGLGSYLAYVPYNSVLFDRLIAHTRVVGTAVFAIYVADALGYTGSIGVQLYRDLFAGDHSRLVFFRVFTYITSALGLVSTIGAAAYFLRHEPAVDKLSARS